MRTDGNHSMRLQRRKKDITGWRAWAIYYLLVSSLLGALHQWHLFQDHQRYCVTHPWEQSCTDRPKWAK